MSDLIDRQEAVVAIEAHLHGVLDGKHYDEGIACGYEAAHRHIQDVINALPSAEVIRCKDCKHKHLENMVWTCPFGLSGGENFFCGYGAEPYGGDEDEKD